MNLENNKTLFVGLWNPQDKYSKTRHNIGADILIRFCKKNNLEFKLDKNSIYHFSSAEINGSNVEIILPMVSMNNSGDALKSYFKYNNKESTEVLIVHDDIDLAFGRLRIKKGSSDGGHNGIKSTNRVLDPEDYYKLKVGVGRPPQGIDPADFVLSKFYNDEREEVEFLIEDSVDILNTFLKDKELAIKEASERRIIDVI
jgi:PTH1 family peptidyl-tRNA hydrolase